MADSCRQDAFILTDGLEVHEAEASVTEGRQMLLAVDAICSYQVVEWSLFKRLLPVLLAVPVQFLHVQFANAGSPRTTYSVSKK